MKRILFVIVAVFSLAVASAGQQMAQEPAPNAATRHASKHHRHHHHATRRGRHHSSSHAAKN